MILVTGGTGLVGAHLLYELTQQHKRVRATFRRKHTIARAKHVFSYYSDAAEDLFAKIEWIEADITNIPQLDAAFSDVSHVYHCAAFVSFEPDKYKELRKINIEGTANVVNCCIAHKVEKLCYVSSIATLGDNKNKNDFITEEDHWDPNQDHNVYAITKYGAELEVWRGSQEGLNVIIVNPGVVLGPGFWRGGSSGSIIRKVHKGLNYYTKGTTGFVDVWDVTKIMIQLMNARVINERFILVAENLSFKAIILAIANALEIQPPKKEAKPWLLNIAWRLDWLSHIIFRRRRQLSKQSARSLVEFSKYDASKIKTYLGFKFNPVENALSRCCEFYLDDKPK